MKKTIKIKNLNELKASLFKCNDLINYACIQYKNFEIIKQYNFYIISESEDKSFKIDFETLKEVKSYLKNK